MSFFIYCYLIYLKSIMGDKKNLIQLSSPTGWKHNSPINHKKIISNIPGQNITLHENNFKYIRDKLDVHGDVEIKM